MTERYCGQTCESCLLPSMEAPARADDAKAVISGVFSSRPKGEIRNLLNDSPQVIDRLIENAMMPAGMNPFTARDNSLIMGTIDIIANDECSTTK